MDRPPVKERRKDLLVAPVSELLRHAAEACENGDVARAEEILRQMTRQLPSLAAAWHLRGLVARTAGDLDRTAEFLARAVALAPDNPRYCTDFGEALERAGRFGEAAMALSNAAAAISGDPRVEFLLGTVLMRCGRYEEAVQHLRKALSARPDWPEVHNNLAAALRAAGRPQEAIHHAEQAVNLRGHYTEALNNLALALSAAGRAEEAIGRLEMALALRPDDVELRNNLAVLLGEAGKTAEAERHLRDILAEFPDRPEPAVNLGNLLRAEGRLEEALACYRRALELRPLDLQIYANLGLLLLDLGKPREAIALYEKALALDPDHSDIRMSLGIAQLLVGDFEHGWRNYESRWRARSFGGTPRRFPIPRWRGDSVAGRTILVHAEQGFGDTLQFCRYIPLLAERGAAVVFECQPALLRLMASLEGVARLVPRGASLPAADCHVPLLSLPAAFTASFEEIPSRVPYLAPPADLAAEWRERLAGEGPAVGLVWSGNPQRRDDAMRSCPPEVLQPLLGRPGIRFFGLQKNAQGVLDSHGVIDLAPELDDFATTAAVLSALDLVIAVDTAVAHLAGALAKPVWVMLALGADWRYHLERSKTPWYPTMRLFRQKEAGDWANVVERIAAALDRELRSRTSRKS